jgi:hypothetical protein
VIPYQWHHYRQHSSQDHLTTQAPPLRQNRDTFGGVQQLQKCFNFKKYSKQNTALCASTPFIEKYYILHTTFTARVFLTNSQLLTQYFSHRAHVSNIHKHRLLSKRIFSYGSDSVIHGCDSLIVCWDMELYREIFGLWKWLMARLHKMAFAVSLHEPSNIARNRGTLFHMIS